MAELLVPAAIDAYMEYHAPDTNYGAALFVHEGPLYFGGSKTFLYRPIGNFDVSALAGHAIQSAQLERTMHDFDGRQPFGVTIFRCTRPSAWTEGGVTWNKYDGVNAWTIGGGDYDLVVPAPVSFVETTEYGLFVVEGLGDFVVDALANRGGIVSVIMKADDEAPWASHQAGWVSKEGHVAGYGASWALRVLYDLALAPDPGRREAAERELAFDNLRGVRPRRGVQPRPGRGGVRPARPVLVGV